GRQRRDDYVQPSKIRPDFDSDRLGAVGSPHRICRIDLHADRKYLRPRRAAEDVDCTSQSLVASAQKILNRNHYARARPGVVREAEQLGLLALFCAGVVDTSRGARLQIQMGASLDRSVGVEERVIEFDQPGWLAAGSQLQLGGFDVGLIVIVVILAAQRRALGGTVDMVVAAPDRNTGVRIQNHKTGRWKAERIG